MTRTALEEFHYAADGKNPVRYPKGSPVPVKPRHVAGLVAEGKIEGALEDGVGSHVDDAAPQPTRARRRRRK